MDACNKRDSSFEKRHKHEIESGRTSSVGGEILGFDSKSQPITHPSSSGRKLTWEEICKRASKVLSFVDLAGHEKYLKVRMTLTMIFTQLTFRNRPQCLV